MDGMNSVFVIIPIPGKKLRLVFIAIFSNTLTDQLVNQLEVILVSDSLKGWDVKGTFINYVKLREKDWDKTRVTSFTNVPLGSIHEVRLEQRQ